MKASPANPEAHAIGPAAAPADWKEIVKRYQVPSIPRAAWQVVNTLGSYAAIWVLMYFSLAISPWLTLPLVILAGMLLVRVFIIFHDCGHGSFFPSKVGNDIVGFVTGMLCFTPYHHWRWEHSLHHATSSDLDRRGVGDVWTMTLQEYRESSRWRRFTYRLARNPIVLFLIAPAFLFLIRQRFASPKASTLQRRSVWTMNFAVAGLATCLISVFGWKAYLLIQLGIIAIGGGIGVWMFYVQHQFEDAYWERSETWDFSAAALQGSSFYRLPRILQWFTGNIGFHHIHHLGPRIPNYHLEHCHKSHAIFRTAKPLTFLGSLRAMRLHLWDEESGKLVGFQVAHARAAHE